MRLVVEGRVQGVFFRVTARDLARSLGVTGWVKNRWDRKVELLLEGEEKAVDEMVLWCRKGPSGAVVTNVRMTYNGMLLSSTILLLPPFTGFYLKLP